MQKLSPPRWGRMQVVAMYDGIGEATLELNLWNPSTSECCWLTIFPINKADIVTQEYDMLGFEPTGKFRFRASSVIMRYTRSR